MESEKRYGEYEMVNGGVVNALRDRLNALEAERDRLRELLSEALAGFGITQDVQMYPDNHWAPRATQALGGGDE